MRNRFGEFESGDGACDTGDERHRYSKFLGLMVRPTLLKSVQVILALGELA